MLVDHYFAVAVAVVAIGVSDEAGVFAGTVAVDATLGAVIDAKAAC